MDIFWSLTKFGNIEVAGTKKNEKFILTVKNLLKKCFKKWGASFVAPTLSQISKKIGHILNFDKIWKHWSCWYQCWQWKICQKSASRSKEHHLWHHLAHWKLMPRAYLLLLLLWTLNNYIRGGLDCFRSKMFKVIIRHS